MKRAYMFMDEEATTLADALAPRYRETDEVRRVIEPSEIDRHALDRLARILDRWHMGAHSEVVITEMAFEIRTARPRCGVGGCVRTKGHDGPHAGKSCGHTPCQDDNGHSDSCLVDAAESAIA